MIERNVRKIIISTFLETRNLVRGFYRSSSESQAGHPDFSSNSQSVKIFILLNCHYTRFYANWIFAMHKGSNSVGIVGYISQ